MKGRMKIEVTSGPMSHVLERTYVVGGWTLVDAHGAATDSEED